MRILIALLAGALFGAGLAISGMADPMRVRAFLDLFGAWDPILAFVMGGGMIPMALAWIVQKQVDRPFADHAFTLPDTRAIDGKLALGAILFGIGGLCPPMSQPCARRSTACRDRCWPIAGRARGRKSWPRWRVYCWPSMPPIMTC